MAKAVTWGDIDIGVSEGLGGRQLARKHGLMVGWLSADFAPVPVALGLWKGELTLQRAVNGGLAEMGRRHDGWDLGRV